MSNPVGVKHDADKPKVDLVPVAGILAAARAFTFGAKKYSPWNWANGMGWLRLYAATLRHLFAWASGEETDDDSGLHHLDHALASLMMLQSHVVLNLGKDDRAHKLLGEPQIPAAHVPKHKNKGYQWFWESLRGWEPSVDYPGVFVSREVAAGAHPGAADNRWCQLREVEID